MVKNYDSKDLPPKKNKNFFGSDIIAQALRDLDVPYACINPGASYRGLHDSIVNFLGNINPRLLVNLHEEHAVAMAHGYAKVTGKPLIAIVHSNVGLMHASMAIFNAWVDRHPILIVGATGPIDAEARRPFIDWIHTSQDQASIIRDYIKWDDQPGSPAAAVESIRRGYQIACTPPRGPVYICLDSGIQEMAIEHWPEQESVSRFIPPAPPDVSKDQLEELKSLIDEANNPLVLCGRINRDKKSWEERIQFIEAIGAKVITNSWQEIGFPTNHPLHLGMSGFYVRGEFKDAHTNADLIISLDWFDLGGTLNDAWDGGLVNTKVVNCSMDFHQHRGWSKDYCRLPPVDLHIPTIPEKLVSAIVPLLDNENKMLMYSNRERSKSILAKNGAISMLDLAKAYGNVANSYKVCLISHTIGWPLEEIHFIHHMAYLGNAGGGGLGAGPGNAVGSALAIRDNCEEYIAVAILGDGDYLMGVQALWTAANEKIPLLIIVANNNSYYNDVVHQETVASARNRDIERASIGQEITNPEVDIIGLAAAQGLTTMEKIEDLNELENGIEEAIKRVHMDKETLVLDVKIKSN